MTTLILLAGGIGRRVGLDIPKQYLLLNNRTVLEHTLDNVSAIDEIDNIVLVSNRDFMKYSIQISEKYSKVVKVVPGGQTRNHSIKNGFCAIDWYETKVIVHDAVRPFTPKWVFSEIVQMLDAHNVVTTVNPITGNLLEIEDGLVNKILDRDKYAIGESPTGYTYKALQKILDYNSAKGTLDKIPHDIQLAIFAGFDVAVLYCNCFNLKLTFRDDFRLMRALLDKEHKGEDYE